VLIIAGVALVMSVLGFYGTLGGYFAGDDFGYVGRFHEYPLLQWPRLFVESWAGQIWGFLLCELRPMPALSFMLDARVWGGNAFGYRATNLLLHASCAWMVGLMAWRIAGRELVCGAAAAMIFALHPVHAEAVAWITGRVDVLATLFYLLGFILFLRWREQGGWRGGVWVTVVYAAAAFSKEFALSLPLMFLLADLFWLQTWRRWRDISTWSLYAGCGAVFATYYICRKAAFGPALMGTVWPNWLSLEFQTQFARRQLAYLGHLFPPAERWLAESAPAVAQHPLRTFWLIATLVLAGLAVWGWRARQRPANERRGTAFFALGWYLVATVPLVITYISPRHLYLASVGVCIALAILLRSLLRNRVVFLIAIVALSGWYIQRLSVTMKPWRAAAVKSGEIARELQRLEPELQNGAALFLDVPEIVDGAYVWTWSVPAALRPPFTRAPLNERLVVLESHGLYFDNGRWPEQPAIPALRRVEAPSWILQARGDTPARRIPVSAEKVRAAAERFAAGPLKDHPHEAWRKLIDELTAP
jgi:4-amino-4-deoxy-L-arabinose transferase-like glycosyltransferase